MNRTLVLAVLTALSSSAAAEELLAPDRPIPDAIDHYVGLKLKQAGVTPAPQADDATLRAGSPSTWRAAFPLPRRRAYVESKDPDKRAKLIDRLMASPDYVRHSATEFDALLQNGSDQAPSLRKYLLAAVKENRPWDRMFRELMGVAPAPNRPDDFVLGRLGDLDVLTRDVTSVFFGVNVMCAQCHKHPYVSSITQDYYFGMKSFFARSIDFQGQLWERQYALVQYKTRAGEVRTPKLMFLSGAVLDEPNPDVPDLNKAIQDETKHLDELRKNFAKGKEYPPRPKVTYRERLADVALGAAERERFARSIVNRLWYRFHGHGLVMRLDQMHAKNPPSHPELLEWLARPGRARLRPAPVGARDRRRPDVLARQPLGRGGGAAPRAVRGGQPAAADAGAVRRLRAPGEPPGRSAGRRRRARAGTRKPGGSRGTAVRVTHRAAPGRLPGQRARGPEAEQRRGPVEGPRGRSRQATRVDPGPPQAGRNGGMGRAVAAADRGRSPAAGGLRRPAHPRRCRARAPGARVQGAARGRRTRRTRAADLDKQIAGLQARHREEAARSALGQTEHYLAAVAELQIAGPGTVDTPERAAARHGLDAGILRRWQAYLSRPVGANGIPAPQAAEAVRKGLYTTKVNEFASHKAVNGWGSGETPWLMANAGKEPVTFGTLTLPPRSVSTHPSPTLAAAVGWRSPIAAAVTITGKVSDVDPNCGNGVGWLVELLHDGTKQILASGIIDNGKSAALPGATVAQVHEGDLLSLVVDARDGNHACDSTHVEFVVAEAGGKGRKWDLAADVVDSIQAANPHADGQGNAAVWHFYAIAGGAAPAVPPSIPPGSVLARWPAAVAHLRATPTAGGREELTKIAAEAQKLLLAPAAAALYRDLTAASGPLFGGVDFSATLDAEAKGKLARWNAELAEAPGRRAAVADRRRGRPRSGGAAADGMGAAHRGRVPLQLLTPFTSV